MISFYFSDFNYKLGTLVEFGGREEVTLSSNSVDAVVIKDNESHTKNSIRLLTTTSGRVPVRVIGTLKKFDRITLSKTNFGVAEKAFPEDKVFGIALEDKDYEEENIIVCSVNISF